MSDERVQSPSERLAKRIVDRLVSEGLISEPQAAKLVQRIAAGTLTQEDWRLAVEMSKEGEQGDVS